MAVVAYSSVLHRTKKIVGDMTPSCGTPCLRSRYDLIHRNLFPAMLHFFSFRSRPSVQTFSNAFCRSIHTVTAGFTQVTEKSGRKIIFQVRGKSVVGVEEPSIKP